MSRKAQHSSEEESDGDQAEALEPITEKQQRFIEGLLAGKTITESALLADVSRRAATYWLASDNTPVRREYEKQRAQASQMVQSRVATLHELALKALEELLAPSTPPWIRFHVARMIYEAHLQQLCTVSMPQSSNALVAGEVERFKESLEWQWQNNPYLYDEKSQERMTD